MLLDAPLVELHHDVKAVKSLPLWTLISFSVSNASIPSECTLFMFYQHTCPFSAKAMAHFNAMGRLFPQMNIYAVDSVKFYS